MILGLPSTQATSAQSAQSAQGAGGSQAATQIIRITDGLSSQHLMATPGTSVTWVNNDNDVHRIKSYKGASVEFDSGVLEPGERFSHRFTSASDVMYRDALDARNTSYVGMVMIMTMKPADAGAVTSSTALAPLAQPQQQPFVLASDGGSGSDGGDNDTAGGPNVKHVTIEMHNKSEFRPGVVTIAKGGTVTWFNDTSDDHTASGAGGINSGRMHRDQRYSHTFSKPGTYDFVCAFHSAMKGTVRVADASGHVPPPPDNGGGKQPPPSNGGKKVAVSINSNFSPRNITIPEGSVVTWTNNDGAPHTATGAGGINSGNLNGGQSYSKTFNTPGTFAYHCSYHSFMTGTIKVTNASGNVPPPPPGGGGGGGNPPPPGGGGGGKAPAPPPPGGGGGGTKAPGKASVSIKDDFFSSKTITVAAGGTVSWTNTGQNAHTVTGSGFDSGPIMSGGHFSHKFASPGTYTYQCVFHSGMTATVKVVGAGGKVPPGAPPGGGGGGKAPGGGGTAPGGGGGGTAPGGGGGGAPAAPGSKTVTVTMGADSFSPSTASARVGDTVVWKNSSPVPHTVTGGPLDSGTVMPGQSYTAVMRSPGTISYRCEFHSGMTATLQVAPAPAGTKLPPPSADTGVSGPSSGGGLPAAPSGGSSSGDSATAPTPPGSKSYTINMSGDAFDPQTLNARVGDKITWVNKDPVPHNVTGGPLDSGTMMPNATYTTVLTEQGTIQYQCTFHPGMTGTLQVAAAPAGTVVPAAPPDTSTGGSAPEAPQGDPPAKPDAGAQNHQVDIVNFLYDPDPVQVHVGDTVTFTNKDAAPHTATAEDKSWDSGNLNQGDSWTLKAEKVGTFHYICTYHPTMAGTLIVKPKSQDISASPPSSDSGGAATTMTSASQVAGFSSGWLALLAFLAGLQLQSRFGSRRRSNSL